MAKARSARKVNDSWKRMVWRSGAVWLLGLTCLWGQQQAAPAAPLPQQQQQQQQQQQVGVVPTYVLGADDVVSIKVIDAEEVGEKPYAIDQAGHIDLPYVGRVQAGGLTVDELKASIGEKFATYIRKPQVTISVVEFRSEPVSVLGSVKSPGVQQLQGHKRLLEVIALSGGLREDAADRVTITRTAEQGPLPLAQARMEGEGRFSTAELNLTEILQGKHPEENIYIRSNDVIAVARAEMVYVLGEVHKTGAFVLHDRQNLSALTALSLAEGLTRTASPQRARILRKNADSATREEVPVNLTKILAGQAPDVVLKPEDILLIPNSMAKNAALRTVEAAIQIGTGIAVFRP